MRAVNPDQYEALLPKKKQTGGYALDPNSGFAVNAQGAVNPNDPAVIAALAQSQAQNPYSTMSGSYSLPAGDNGSQGTRPGPIDYQSYIENDPIYRQQRADLSAQGISDAAARKAAVQRALIQWGEVPDLQGSINGLGLDPNSPLYQMLFGDVDQQTRNSANDLTEAGYSQYAQLKQQHDKNINDLMDQLAARGVVRSGATMSGANTEAQRYGGAQFTGRQSLLDYLSGVQSAFAQSERGRQSALGQGAGDATTRQIALHPYTGGDDGSSNPAPPPPKAPPVSTPQPPPSAFGAPQSSSFGGANGPYIGTMPPAPTISSVSQNQANQNSLVKRLNLPE